MVSAETLRVRIEAQDAASATLVRIGQRAAELERALERLETRGTPGEGAPPRREPGRDPGSAGASKTAVVAEDRAAGAAAAVRGAVTGLDGRAATVVVTADTEEAGRRLGEVGARHAELDGRRAVIVVGAETTGAAAALAATSREHGALDGRTATVRVAMEGAEAAAAALRGLDGAVGERMVTVAVVAETAGAQAALAATAAQHGALAGATATMAVEADTVAATGALAGARAAHAALDGATATLRVTADTSDARSGIAWAAGYAGRVLATSYIDIVTRRSEVGIGPSARHGGVPRMAHGGVVLAEMHEAGPEVLHGPGGERAVSSGRGVYAMRAGTYVSPAPASRGQVDGLTLGDIHIHGNVYGMDDLAERVTRELAPAISEELARYRTAMGMTGGGW